MASASFIVPCFNEEENVDCFYTTFADVFDKTPIEWRLIFVDDGSKDNTWRRLQAISLGNPKVTAIRFSRNFGKEAAIWAGLSYAQGDIVGIIDADLQQPPEDAAHMCELLVNDSSYDCVAAYQENRYEKGPLGKIKQSFYGLFSKLSGLEALQDASDFRVFRHSVADAILQLPESFRFSKGIFAWIGFNTLPYPYTPADRLTGESKWTFSGLTKYAIEGMLAFSVTPLRLATILGFIAASCAVVYFLIIVIQTIATGVDVPGYATLMSVVLLLGGAQLICIGIMGEYVARTYLQGKQRPIYLTKEVIEDGKAPISQ